jgi:ABC-type transport system involved in cytochrome c biogenesis permease subunit
LPQVHSTQYLVLSTLSAHYHALQLSMQNSIFAILVFLLGIHSAIAGSPPPVNFDVTPWRYLPVQEGGRQKPFDTLAQDSVRTMTNRAGLADPETGQYLDATALYLAMLFDWQGWDQAATLHPPADMDMFAAYDRLHKPDKWDHAPLIFVDKELRSALGLTETQKYVSPADMKGLKYSDPQTAATAPLLEWAEKLNRKKPNDLSAVEKKGQALAERYWAFILQRMGQSMEILPFPNDPQQEWASLTKVMLSDYDDKSDPQGKLRKIKDSFLKSRAAYHRADDRAFQETSSAFVNALKDLGAELRNYPSPEMIELEVAYNHAVPFRVAWMLMLSACAAALASRIIPWKFLHYAAMAMYFAAIAGMLAGFTMRVIIADRAPITNMYESMLSVALAIAVMGSFCVLAYRKPFYLIEAAIMSAGVLILADAFSDPSIRPLPPVLRSGFWLWTHVTTIMISYAMFAMAWFMGNVSLGCNFFRRADREFQKDLDQLTLLRLRIGVFLLTVGTLLGGLWADYSWGRFWGWDSKEVWALITLLCYLMVLHARYVGWIADFGVALCSVGSFVTVIMTWYVVNFIFATGMHSYGSGSGGGGYYVLAALAVQFLYLLAATKVKYAQEDASAPIVRK